MEGWKEYLLEDVGKITTGKTPRTAVKENFDGTIPFVTPADINTPYKYITETGRYLTEEGLNSIINNSIEKGSICVSCIGNIGYTGIVQKKCASNQQINSITVNKEHNRDFIYYAIKNLWSYFKNYEGQSTTVSILNKGQFAKIPIKCPPLPVQQKIAFILSSLDDKIECNRRINDNLEQQAQALFKSWLSECHEEITIGQLSHNILDYKKCTFPQVVLINSSDVTEGHFEHHNYTENKNLKGHFKKRFKKGDILYSQVRPRNRHWGYCTFDADAYLASTQLMVIRNREDVISSILLYQYLIDDNVWLEFTNKTETRSGTFPQGNYEEISSIKVPFGADMTNITIILNNLYGKIFNNEKQNRILSQLRDTLLPRLMSGELEIQDIEESL